MGVGMTLNMGNVPTTVNWSSEETTTVLSERRLRLGNPSSRVGTMPKQTPQEAVLDHLAIGRIPISLLESNIGDDAGSLGKWLRGQRSTLPLRLKVELSKHTGIPLVDLAEPNEIALAKTVAFVLARDGAEA